VLISSLLVSPTKVIAEPIVIVNPLELTRDGQIQYFTTLYGANINIVNKVIECESSGKHSAVGDSGLSKGIFQFQKATFYRMAKLFGEELCRVYAKMYGLKTIIFRYFNVYGNREPITGPYAPVIGRFLNQRRLGQCLTIVGDGSQRRDFTHVSDVVNANTQASTIQLSEYGQLFNIGTGKNYSIKQIADMISSNQESTCSRIGEASETLADVTKAHQLLEWSARVSLVDYIREKVDD
jgi:nucleoside-diphosphate-sugar epimerase